MPSTYYCQACGVIIDQRGVAGHTRSTKHIKAGGRPMYADMIDPDKVGDVDYEPPNTVRAAAETVISGFGEEMREDVTERIRLESALDEMAARLAEAERENASLKERVEDLRPTADVALYSTLAEVEEVWGGRLEEVVELRLGEINKVRIRQGLLPWDFQRSPDILERTKREVMVELLSRRTKFAEENPTIRVVKMVFNGNLVQVPLELQINNEAGQQGAAIWKMRAKGAKLAMPYFCMRNNCWIPAAVDAHGSLTLDGYCLPAHRATDPYLKGTAIAGVTTSGGAHIPTLSVPIV